MLFSMIKSYRHKGLRELFERGATRRIDETFRDRCQEILVAINTARHTNQLNVPGYVLHPLHQHKPLRWSIRVRGPWRITFEFDNAEGNAYHVDLEQYHRGWA
jgi:proteic killer suppression protein